jgi:hypothetical protein
MTDAKPSLKARALHEFARFATMFAYLWVMFFLFQLHQYVVLAQRHIPFEQYGVALLNALVLLKVMLVADDLRTGPDLSGPAEVDLVRRRVHRFRYHRENGDRGLARQSCRRQHRDVRGRRNLVAIIVAIALVPFFASWN